MEYATTKEHDGGFFKFDGNFLGRPPSVVKKISDNEVRYVYDGVTVIVTAEGSGDVRYNPKINYRPTTEEDLP